MRRLRFFAIRHCTGLESFSRGVSVARSNLPLFLFTERFERVSSSIIAVGDSPTIAVTIELKVVLK